VTPASQVVDAVARRCIADDRIRAALTYGSVAQGNDDAYSDAELWLFPADPALDTRRWITDAVDAIYLADNEFGAVVAFLAGGLRVEFHFHPDISAVSTWPARGASVEAMVLVDRDGTLARALAGLPETVPAEDAVTVCGRFANWWLLGWNVLARGEYERALDALSHARCELLRLARLRQGVTDPWLTPSRMLERQLRPADLASLAATSSTVDPARLRAAYVAAWQLGERWWRELADPPEELFADLRQLQGTLQRPAGLGWPAETA
jgi:lincosamide nucleotidyltransferase